MNLGIDIGATKTQIGYIKNGRLIKSKAIGTKGNPEIFMAELIELINDFTGNDLVNISKIGIGAPGPLDYLTGTFGKLPNLPDWEGFSVKNQLEQIYNVSVSVQNDANVAALGEAVYGGGKGFNSICYITLSTGIGAGFVIDGKILTGRNNLAGEIWAFNVNNLGIGDILLNASSGPGIVKNVYRLIKKGEKSTLKKLQTIKPEDVFKHYIAGDLVAKKVLENAWENMAIIIESIILVLDPDIILLGGGLCFDEKYMVLPIRRKVQERLILKEFKKNMIRRSKLWDRAVIYGAIALSC